VSVSVSPSLPPTLSHSSLLSLSLSRCNGHHAQESLSLSPTLSALSSLSLSLRISLTHNGHHPEDASGNASMFAWHHALATHSNDNTTLTRWALSLPHAVTSFCWILYGRVDLASLAFYNLYGRILYGRVEVQWLKPFSELQSMLCFCFLGFCF